MIEGARLGTRLVSRDWLIRPIRADIKRLIGDQLFACCDRNLLFDSLFLLDWLLFAFILRSGRATSRGRTHVTGLLPVT
jgi:hypothetical protein